MKRFNKIALSVVAMVAVGMGLVGCVDESKSPLMETEVEVISSDWFGINAAFIKLQSRDDETIIKKMTIKGRNGKCNIKDLGAGGRIGVRRYVKYGEKIEYNGVRQILFDNKICPPKNGKYEIELDTNFGTYYYEIGR